MHLYTFSLGEKAGGAVFLFSSWGWNLAQAIEDGRAQLGEQLDANRELKINLDWGLQGRLWVNPEDICERNVIGITRDTMVPFDSELTNLEKAA